MNGFSMAPKQKRALWTRLQLILFVMVTAASICWFSLWWHYVATRPRSPEASEGRIIPLHSHGVTVYLNNDEKQRLAGLYCTGSASGLGIFVIELVKRMTKGAKGTN